MKEESEEKLRQIIINPWDRIYKFYGQAGEKDFKAGQLVSAVEIQDYNIKEKFLEEPWQEQEVIFKGSTKESILAENIGKEEIQKEDLMNKEILEKAIKDVNQLAQNYLEGGAKEGVNKTALEAIQEISDIAEKARKEQFIKK